MSLIRHRSGRGEPLALLHGVASSWRDWRPMLPALELERDVVVLALPGHHGAPGPTGDARPSVAWLVDGIERELDTLGWREAHLVGNSLGGWVALELARRGRARSVVAIAPAGLWNMAEARALRRRVLRNHRIARWISPAAPLLARSTAASRMLLRGAVREPGRIAPEEAVHKLKAYAGCRVLRPLLEDACGRRAEGFDSIVCPVLVAWGDRDAVLPFAQSERFLDALPEARLVGLPGLGHLPMWEEPERLAALVLEHTRPRESREAVR